jgi:hypothetical protein
MRTKNWREKIAFQAARLMCDAAALGYEAARQEAIRTLGCGKLPPRQLPTKKEIREKLALLSRDQQVVLRHRLFKELLVVMRRLRAFHPQVEAEMLTVPIAPDARYEIKVIDAPVETIVRLLPEATRLPVEKAQESRLQTWCPSEEACIYLEGVFFLCVRIGKDEVGALQKPHMGIVALESEIKMLDTESEREVMEMTSSPPDRFVQFAALLWPLEEVMLSPTRHPEGDALYHSLQVFQLASDARPYDEEFLLAALLHDVGKAIDPEDHLAAGLAALNECVSERTAVLIELHPQAHCYLDSTLGVRARRRLEANPNFEELLLLAECDKKGRQCGIGVPDVEQALAQIRSMSDTYSD